MAPFNLQLDAAVEAHNPTAEQENENLSNLMTKLNAWVKETLGK